MSAECACERQNHEPKQEFRNSLHGFQNPLGLSHEVRGSFQAPLVRLGYLPIADWLFSYQKDWLRPDIIAGLTTAAVVIPKAMAYATIAGLPVQVGLYTALVPMAILRPNGDVSSTECKHHDYRRSSNRN